MSAKVSGWVWHHAPVKSGELVVLLALADNAHDDGGGAYPMQATLARKSRLSVRQVRRCLNTLEAHGLIRRTGVGPNGAACWQVVMDDRRADNMSGPDDVSGGHGRPPGPDTSVLHNHQEPAEVLSRPSEKKRGTARTAPLSESAPQRAARTSCKPVTYRNKTIARPTVEIAERLLAAFNDATGSQLGARTADGRGSPMLRQIIGALLDRPDVDESTWDRGLRSMCADPPSWADGRRLIVGDIFGERAREHTLARGRGDMPAQPRRFQSRRPRAADFQALKGTRAAA